VEIIGLENMLKFIFLVLERPKRLSMFTNVAAIVAGKIEANAEMARTW
jgi:hypothetical protein